MHHCDTILQRTVISMGPDRRVFPAGYVAIGDGRIRLRDARKCARMRSPFNRIDA